MWPQPDKSISIGTLEEEQALKLFRMTIGEDTINSHPKILGLAKTVAKKCGGLPLALTIIGKPMSGKREPKQWERVIKTFGRPALQRSKDREDERAMGKLFSVLWYIYDSLPIEKVKSCFIYCALFPEGFGIPKMQLVEILAWEDSCIDSDVDEYEEVDARYEEAYRIVTDLVHASILEDKGEWVKMPDVIRSMALWIAKADMLVMDGMQIKEEPRVGRWERMKRVSFMQTNIEELNQVPACPHLLTLFLSRNSRLHRICNGFFESMSKSTVINLSRSAVKELPESISGLICLKYLNISHTDIQKLPTALTKLTNLSYFDVVGLDLKLERSKPVINKLVSLQSLKIICDYCYDEDGGREVEGQGDIAVNKISSSHDGMLLKELQQLENLKVLEITLGSLSGLNKLANTSRLSRSTQCLELAHFKDPKSMDLSMLAKLERLEELLVCHCDFKELNVESTGNSNLYRSTTCAGVATISQASGLYLSTTTSLLLDSDQETAAVVMTGEDDCRWKE